MSQAVSAAQELEPEQRTRLGTGAMVIGVALIGVLGFAPIASTILQVLLGIIGVLILVVGVLLIGTSGGSV
jgi:glucose uptake protein GlcU